MSGGTPSSRKDGITMSVAAQPFGRMCAEIHCPLLLALSVI